MARPITPSHVPLWLSVAATQVDCWKITRRDGGIIRITNHDQPVWIGAEEYLPGTPTNSGLPLGSEGGAEGFAHTTTSGLGDSASAISGLLSSDSITIGDLVSGLYERATILHSEVDARNPDAGGIVRTYVVTQVAVDDSGRWRFEIAGKAQAALSEPKGDVLTLDCRNQLFDQQCSRAKTPGGSDGLVRDQWQIGLASGNYGTIRAIVNPRTFDVALPAALISALIPSGPGAPTGTQVNTSSEHYLAGLSPLAATRCKMPVGIRGNVGHVPGINGVISEAVAEVPNPGTTINALGQETVSAGSTLGRIGFEPIANQFKRGLLMWKTGNNEDVTQVIASSEAFVVDVVGGTNGYVRIVCDARPPRAVTIGDQVMLEAGCDGTTATCFNVFDNVVNMRAEPTVSNAYETLRTPNTR